jgi:hypothetical protein
MLETTPRGQRVYELGLITAKRRGTAKDESNAPRDPDQDEETDDDTDSSEAPTGT